MVLPMKPSCPAKIFALRWKIYNCRTPIQCAARNAWTTEMATMTNMATT